MIKQKVSSLIAINTQITQTGGNYQSNVINYNESQIDLPIYFSYGDSDVQTFIYEVGKSISEDDYFKVMEEALRLLLLFKPFSTELVLAPSSIIQSELTENLIKDFLCFSLNECPHLLALRREVNWKDYISKRENDTKSLIKIPRFSNYFQKKVIEKVSMIRSTSKKIRSGNVCASIWVNESYQFYNSIHGGKILKKETLFEIAQEILDNNIFVWETIDIHLKNMGLIIPKWKKDLQLSLVRSYLSVYSKSHLIPTGINLPWEFWPHKPSRYYADLKVCRQIVNYLNKKYKDFIYGAPPNKLLKLISEPLFLEYKRRIENGEKDKKILIYASKYKKLFSKAIKRAN